MEDLTEYEKALVDEVEKQPEIDPPRGEDGAILRDENGRHLWRPFVTVKAKKYAEYTPEELKRYRTLKMLTTRGLIYWDVDFENREYEFTPISLAKRTRELLAEGIK